MIYKSTVYRKNGQAIYLEYDMDKFSIQHAKEMGFLVLSRNDDNRILSIFRDNVGFIVQDQTGINYNFFVSKYYQKEDLVKFSHYSITDFMNAMKLRFEEECDSINIDSLRIRNNVFALRNRKKKLVDLYSSSKGEWICSEVFNHEDISSMLGENVLLVNERRCSLSDSNLVDTVTYGLDVLSYEIVTPIWSKVQDRLINLYTDEEIREKLYKGMNLTYLDNFSETMVNEVEKYLDLLGVFTRDDNVVMLDGNKVNMDFVKKFVRK